MISCFERLKSSTVLKEIDIYEFVEVIKNPDSKTQKRIEQTRSYYHNCKETYDSLKAKLPCFALNFRFKEKRRNDNIIEPTGLIYLDVDKSTDIDLNNPYVFASWLSISNNGRGILVRVENLTIDNFKDTYLAIAKELNIDVDIRAAKPTQPTLHSFDKDIYFNEDAITWICDNNPYLENTPNTSLNIIKKRKGNDVIGENLILRFNNFDEVDFKGKEYLHFKDEKKLMASVIIPRKIKAGSRNSIISAITYQIRALNPCIAFAHLKALIDSININCCKPTLKDEEIYNIAENVINLEDIEPILNSPRRFLFNPVFNLTHKQKMKIVNTKNGQALSEKTIKEIANCIDNWDVKKQGSISQTKLKVVTGKSIGTIEKYYKLFKSQIADIKEQYKLLKLGQNTPAQLIN
ncbi:BT4734/BF3469 family protein [uncultured Polaribacter sp.]|uniref:BT4734/BF3469 family protein n=1 Tax=uncultured Polaribacter sp. TaxID=174711 RepID=UPI00261A2614|nr:BT4734/BF3469 family protein [uncultured Polaribacter sp.]